MLYFAVFPLGRALTGTGSPCGGLQNNPFADLPGISRASSRMQNQTLIGEELVTQYLDQQEVRPRCSAERISDYQITSLKPFDGSDASPDHVTLDLWFNVEYPLGVGDWIGWGGAGGLGPWVRGKHTHVDIGLRNGRYVITGMGMG